MNSKLKPGDLLHRSKGIIQHAGVYLGDGLVLHNQPTVGSKVTSYAQYAVGKTVKVTRFKRTDLNKLTERLYEIIDDNQGYALFGNNCEHIASYLIQGRKLSPQIQATTICAVIGGAIGHRNGKLAYGLILGGLIGLAIANTSRKYDFCVG